MYENGILREFDFKSKVNAFEYSLEHYNLINLIKSSKCFQGIEPYIHLIPSNQNIISKNL